MKPENVLKIGSHIEMQAFDKENYLIINNHTEKYLKINSTFYKLITIIDGTKTLEEIFVEFNLNNPQPISEENSEKLIEKLESIGLFHEENLIKKKKKLPEYLTIGFIFLPKNFVGKLVPLLKFLFDKKSHTF